MKYNKIKNISILISSIAVLSLQACTKEFSDIPFERSEDFSILEMIESREDLSAFTEIVYYTNSDASLRTAGSYTLFAPNNEAVEMLLKEMGIYSIKEKPVEFWMDFVRYHLVKGKINTFTLETGTMEQPTYYNDKFLVAEIAGSYENIYLNSCAKIIDYNYEQTNGYLHIIDHCLQAPTKSIYQLLKESGNYEIMTGIFEDFNLVDYLDKAEKVTLVVEPDSILNRLNFNKEQMKNLEKWAKYHISDEDDYTVKELSADRRYPILGNAWAIYNRNGDWKFSGNEIPFIKVDNVASNGIFHAVADTLSLYCKDKPVPIVFPFYYPGSRYLKPNVKTSPMASIHVNADSNSKWHTEKERADGLIADNEHEGKVFGFNAQIVGDWFEFTIEDVPAGKYKLEILNASIARGRADFVPVCNGKVIGPISNFGANYDRYQYGSKWKRWHTLTPIGELEVAKRGPVTIRMVVQKLNSNPSYKWDLIADQAILTPIE